MSSVHKLHAYTSGCVYIRKHDITVFITVHVVMYTIAHQPITQYIPLVLTV